MPTQNGRLVKVRLSMSQKISRHGSDRSERRRGNQQGGVGHEGARKAGGGRGPAGEALLNLRCAELDIQLPVGNVEHNHVALCDRGNRSTVGGLGRDVSSHESVGGAGKTAIGEQSDGIAETGAHQGGGYREHFTHARPAFRALITDDDYIARLDDVLFNGCKSGFFLVKHARRATKILQVMTGDFYNAAFRSEISLEDDESAGRLERRIELADNLLRRRFLSGGRFFSERASGNREAVPAKQSGFKKALCDQRSAACCVEIRFDQASSRRGIRDNA